MFLVEKQSAIEDRQKNENADRDPGQPHARLNKTMKGFLLLFDIH